MSVASPEIIPGKGIGVFELGWTFDQLKQHVNSYRIEQRQGCFVVLCDDIEFLINEESNAIDQILVFGNSQAKLHGSIGIGSTLENVESYVGEWYDDGEVYEIKGLPGVGFEISVKFTSDWDERKAPIVCICVYDTSESLFS